MIESSSYFFIVLNISAGLLTLLGAVGLFVSLIIQRRVERLQDILEELLDLSYVDEKNTSVKIQNLIYKYQMQYLLPAKPIRTVLTYINITIVLVILFWSWLFFLTYQPPFQWRSILYFLPMVCVSAVMVYYRQLIKNTINPVGNNLFNSIIPSPRYLRSITFLSGHVNVSVATIIQQARPTPVLRRQKHTWWEVVLKEELPFDDYHYYFCISDGNDICFLSFGHLVIELDPDPITGKPRPTARNLNIPLGIMTNTLPQSALEACFMIFPKGEKHPIEFCYSLSLEGCVYCAPEIPSTSVNHLITYSYQKDNVLNLLTNDSREQKHCLIPLKMAADDSRYFFDPEENEYVKVMAKPFVD